MASERILEYVVFGLVDWAERPIQTHQPNVMLILAGVFVHHRFSFGTVASGDDSVFSFRALINSFLSVYGGWMPIEITDFANASWGLLLCECNPVYKVVVRYETIQTIAARMAAVNELIS